MGLYIGLGITVVVFLFLMKIYNSLVLLRNAFKNAFSQIDVQLQRRYDLIPNLVETAKKFMSHEKETFEAVIAARNQAQSAAKQVSQNPADSHAVGKLNQAEGQLTQNMGKMMLLFENYPELKADSVMKDLMEELTSTENKISFARQAFNDSVMHYNNGRETFPNSLIAGTFGFQQAYPFEIENAAAKEAVKVQF